VEMELGLEKEFVRMGRESGGTDVGNIG